MSYAGYAAAITVMGENPISMSAEAMSGSGAGPYLIDSTIKRVWDPATALTFYEGGIAISMSDVVSIDYLLGTVTFATSKSGAITVSGKYYLMYPVTNASEISMEIMRDMLDTTVFTSSGYKSRLPGLFDMSGSMHIKGRLDTDYSTGSGVREFLASLTAGTPFVISLRPLGSSTEPRFRLLAVITKAGHPLKVTDLVEGDVDFQLYTLESIDGYPVSFSFTDTAII